MSTLVDAPATAKQIGLIHLLLADRDQQAMTHDQKLTWAKIEAASEHPIGMKLASKAITILMGMPAVTTDVDLTNVPDGRYGVPGGTWTTRLKVEIQRGAPESRWAGVIFVRDAAEYGQGKNYGRQNPGRMYRGDIAAELRAIAADPRAAAKRYGELTNRCCNCNRPLEDETSVALGIGPICRKKYWS